MKKLYTKSPKEALNSTISPTRISRTPYRYSSTMVYGVHI